MKSNIFNRDARFIIIEQIRKSTLSRETKKTLLRQRENFWILKLEILKPERLNKELKKLRGQTNALPSYAIFIFLPAFWPIKFTVALEILTSDLSCKF